MNYGKRGCLSNTYARASGGTAGCVLASKLSADPNVSVLLLERGPVLDTWASKVPLMSVDYRPPTAPKYSWLSAPLAGALGTPPLEMISGKALGGTSKINAFVYARSTPGEYNAWEEAGRKGWGWKDVEPYFVAMERTLSYESPYRGDKGEHGRRDVPVLRANLLSRTVEAAQDRHSVLPKYSCVSPFILLCRDGTNT